MMKQEHFFAFILVLYSFFINAQNENFSYIKSVELLPVGSDSFAPFVPLGTSLQLSFDDLEGDGKEYQYKIEHMTFDWKPSRGLVANQYINGFEQNTIQTYNNSFNTLQSYTNYVVQIPNRNISITKSGNYLLSVINEDDEVVFTRRFVLYENLTTVGVSVKRSSNTKTANEQQTVHFLINHKGINFNNPQQEVKVALLQNNDWKTAIFNLKPQFFNPNQLVYNYVDVTNFWGGNEFLNFDNKNIRNTNMNIAKVERNEVYHNYLYTNEPRAGRIYTYSPDINGQFVIRSLEGNDANTEADYAMIHFSLATANPYKNKEVYVYGAFNNFMLTQENKMNYNTEKRAYEASILLKQGFYNYTFATKDIDGKIDVNEINGSFYETENEYAVLVYYKPFGELYDRVIGFGTGFFNQNR